MSASPSPSFEYKPAYTLHGHKKAISSVRFSPDGSMLASSSNDRSVRIWNAHDGAFLSSLIGHSLGISDLSWSPDSAILATGSDDTTVCIWNQSNGRLLNTLRGHSNYVMSVNFHPEGHLLATGGFDHTARIWDVERGVNILNLPAHADVVCSAHYNNDGSKLVTGGFDGYTRVWDTKSGKMIRDFVVSSPSVPCCFSKWSPNSKYLLVGSFGPEHWKLIDADSGSTVKVYEGHKFDDYCVFASFSLTGNKSIISGSADNSICIWDINSKKLLQKLEGHDDVVVAVAAHPTDNIIASGALDEDKTVRIWKVFDDDEDSDGEGESDFSEDDS